MAPGIGDRVRVQSLWATDVRGELAHHQRLAGQHHSVERRPRQQSPSEGAIQVAGLEEHAVPGP